MTLYRQGISIGSWFIGGEMKFFEDSSTALEWLDQD